MPTYVIHKNTCLTNTFKYIRPQTCLMKKHILVLSVLIAGCEAGKPAKQIPVKDTVAATQPAPVAESKPVPADMPEDGNKISGDFNGDGQTEFAYVVKTKEGHGNPVEDGVPDEYSLKFSNASLAPVNIGCCEARLIKEGDLNKDGRDEISVFQAPMNGNTNTMTTYSFQHNSWKVLMAPFLIPTAGDAVSDQELQQRIFLENDSIYFYDIDVNDENFKLIKTKAVLK
jgi:hypothetical protein